MSFRPLFVAAALAIALPAAAQDALPEGPGKAAVQETCTQCHDLGPILAQRRSAEDWADVVERMKGFGASLTDSQKAGILAYLTASLGKGDAPSATPAPAPAGPAPAAR